MSSDQNNTQAAGSTQARRMSSIRRRLSGAWLRHRLGDLFGRTLFLLLLVPVLILGTLEWRELGAVRLKTERRIEAERNTDGKITQLNYTAKLPESEQTRFKELHPDCTADFTVNGSAVSHKWREHDRYYHFRRCFKHKTWVPFDEPWPEE